MFNRLLPLIFAFSLSPATVSADVAHEAEFFDGLARRAYSAGAYEEALESFLLANEVAPSPRGLYNIAVSADLARREAIAFEQYNEYLRSSDTDAARRQQARLRVTQLQSKLAIAEVRSQPPGVAIYIDRQELGQYGVTPRSIVVSNGEHELVLERDGYRTKRVPIVARLGFVVPVDVALEPELGTLVAKIIPQEAKLEFLSEDRAVEAVHVGFRYQLPVGAYTVLVSAPAHATIRVPVVLRKNDAAEIAVELAPLPQLTGRLLITTGRTAAEVFIDGRRVTITPATLSVLAGSHSLELQRGARIYKKQITIVQGTATYLEVDLGDAPK